MNTDIFLEQLVKRHKTNKDHMKIGLSLLAVFLVVIAITMVPFLISLFFPIALILTYVEYLFIKRFNLEFEYILTGSELDIDRIVNQIKRKRQITVDVKSFKIMAPHKDPQYANELKDYTKIYDFRSNREDALVYAAIANVKNEKVKILFEPKEEIIRSIKMFIPNQVKLHKNV